MRSNLVWVSAVIVACLVILWAGPLGRAEAWGAHPYWAGKVAVYGAGPGLVLWLALRRSRRRRLILPLAIVVSVLAAHYGKQIFAASLAENTVAGKFWFYGWIAFCASLTATWAAINEAIIRRA